MVYSHGSHKSTSDCTEFPAAQISSPGDVTWSAAANDGQVEHGVANHTSGWTEQGRTQCVCLDLCRIPKNDSSNIWSSIEPRVRTPALEK